MRKIIFYLALTAFILPVFSQEIKQLTQEQKINDFEYLYKVLEDNYPYFGVTKRKHGIDWLAKKDDYLTMIKNTQDDSTYVRALESILKEVRNGHTDILPTIYHEEMVTLYSSITPTYPRYERWVKALKDPLQRSAYWEDVLNYNSSNQTNTSSSGKENMNYTDTLIHNKGIAIMRINSFDGGNIEKDSPLIDSFLNNIQDARYLIIDIQKNSGGSTDYWSKNIVSRLTNDTIFYSSPCIIKDGEINRRFYPESFENSSPVQLTGQLVNIPEEILDGSYHMQMETDTILPNDPVSFAGNIFLLTSRRVYSSSEGFAHFCKSTQWATIAGERTGGDGVGSDPVIFVLPESGILVRYPALTGFNADGSLNFEERTTPDIPIDADSFDERLNKLIEFLSID